MLRNEAEAKLLQKQLGDPPVCQSRVALVGSNIGHFQAVLQCFLERRIQKQRCVFAPLAAGKLLTGKPKVNKSKPNQRTQD